MSGVVFDRIKTLRENKKITQQEIADHLHVSQRTYSRYELGQHDIPTEILIELSGYHRVSVDYILGLTNNPERNA